MAKYRHIQSGIELRGMEYTGDDKALEEFVAGGTEGVDPKVGDVVIADPGLEGKGVPVYVVDASQVELVE